MQQEMMQQRITENFTESITAKEQALPIIAPAIIKAANLIISTFNNGNKLLICGNGGSAADSQHFAAEFTGRYEKERAPLPAIALTTDSSALTAIANDYAFDIVFAKQVMALGKPGDILMGISTSGNSTNVIKAIEAAKQRKMPLIMLTGKDGGKIGTMLASGDAHICVPHPRTARIQEVHILVLHTICNIIDCSTLGL